MNQQNETCVQRVQVVFFNPAGRTSNRLRRIPLLNRWTRAADVHAGGVEPSDSGWEKIQAMIHTLQKKHDDWSLYSAGNRIVLETTSFDFNDISMLLEKNGFNRSDYDLSVEYERKWGML